MVLGVLFVLTLSTFISGSEVRNRFVTLYMTLGIVAPFLISAWMLLKSKRERLKVLKSAKGWDGQADFLSSVCI